MHLSIMPTLKRGQWKTVNIRKEHFDIIKKLSQKTGHATAHLLGFAINEFVANLNIQNGAGRKAKRKISP
jgi:hypothetical protein